ncbi:MAG: NAD-dependent malic enzyme [Candidatus Aminicenantes bacterium]|nr:NAD-dependent malic enzyme [Candidatus Aminicenantes bacterium]
MRKFVIQVDPLTGEKFIEVPFRKHHIIENSIYNKSSAFTLEERESLDLWGLLPEKVSTLEEQCQRVIESYSRKTDPLEKYIYLLSLLDRNETLFYRVFLDHLEEMLPYVYTPTVGEAAKTFSHIFRKLRGLFVSANRISLIDRIFSNAPFSNIHLIVVTDGERILGLGDQGIGGMAIPIGKISLYVVAAGIHPALCLPVCIDVGTNNENLQKDPLYIGLKNKRLEGEEYDFVIEEFVKGVRRNFPHAILQWEDFGKQNALRLLNRYRERICSFNDDIQGTGAIALATIYSAMRLKEEKLKDQRYVIFGFGQAGYGIANALVRGMMEEGLTEKESKERIYPVDKEGLLIEGMTVDEYQRPFVREKNSISGWKLEKEGFIGLKDTIVNAKATVLIGVSGVAGAFNEDILKAMARNCEFPLILALSNPTSKSECSPEAALRATDGRCLIATGSPFPPVKFNGIERFISQCNNMYIFPGIGLGAIVSMSLKITDEMFVYSAKQVADLVSQEDLKRGKLLPDIKNIRQVSEMVAFAVAKISRDSGFGIRGSDEKLLEMIRNSMWDPKYLPYRWAGSK